MPNVGDLVPCTDGTWMTLPPKRCPNGHTLGPRNVLVGHRACNGNHHGGHQTWRCLHCNLVVFGPALTPDCDTTIGPGHREL